MWDIAKRDKSKNNYRKTTKKSAQKFGWNKIKYYLCTIKNKTT